MKVKMMSRRRRRALSVQLKGLLLCFSLLCLSISAKCEGFRSTHLHDDDDMFKFNPKQHRFPSTSRNSAHFFLGFFPKRQFPVPASAPSRKHNDLGLQNWRSP
uniref:Uncharacterized protein n=1 Tax=Opuntia streptacantha TaxID=393608 RepID=A0A7C8Z3J5_OPUST